MRLPPLDFLVIGQERRRSVANAMKYPMTNEWRSLLFCDAAQKQLDLDMFAVRALLPVRLTSFLLTQEQLKVVSTTKGTTNLWAPRTPQLPRMALISQHRSMIMLRQRTSRMSTI